MITLAQKKAAAELAYRANTTAGCGVTKTKLSHFGRRQKWLVSSTVQPRPSNVNNKEGLACGLCGECQLGTPPLHRDKRLSLRVRLLETTHGCSSRSSWGFRVLS